MSLKVKLISMVSLLMLMLGVLIIGVYAATQTINLRGSVEFDIGDTSLYIRDIRVQTEPTGSAETIDDFIPGYANQSIDLNLGTIQSNSGSVNVYFDFVNTTSTAYQATATGGSGVRLSTSGVINGSGTPIGNVTTADISGTITLTIQFTGGTAGNVDLDGIEISIEEYGLTEYSDFLFGITSDSTAEFSGYIGTDSIVEIPESFSIMTIDTGVAGYTETFNTMEEYNNYINSNVYNRVILTSGYFYVTTKTTERTLIKDYNSFSTTLTEEQFPITIETSNYEITYEDFSSSSLGGSAILIILKPLYEIIAGEVGGATIEFNSGETYEINITNAMEIIREISYSMSSLSENSFPVSVSYSTEKTMFIEGDDYLVTSIGIDAFSGNINLTNVTIPDSVTSIGERAFLNCSSLTSITIPEGVISIGNQAFYNCSSLTSITIPDSVTSIIGGITFYGCDSSAYRVDEYGVSYLGNDNTPYIYLADAPTTLTSYTIKDTCKFVGGSAFLNCSGLTSITIPEGVTNIGGSAFQGCYRLTSITIPSSVTNINGSAFAGCSRLEYNVDEYGVSYLGNNDTPYVYLADAPTTLTSYTIKNTCKAIGDSAFRGCSRLTSITIPESVTSIGDIAFMGCSGLATIALNTPYSWMISESDVTNSITLTASQVQTNALAYLTSDYLYYQWQALV